MQHLLSVSIAKHKPLVTGCVSGQLDKMYRQTHGSRSCQVEAIWFLQEVWPNTEATIMNLDRHAWTASTSILSLTCRKESKSVYVPELLWGWMGPSFRKGSGNRDLCNEVCCPTLLLSEFNQHSPALGLTAPETQAPFWIQMLLKSRQGSVGTLLLFLWVKKRHSAPLSSPQWNF